MRHRFAESVFEQRFYVLAPHIGPYSLFRFLGEALLRVVGPVAAVRAIATLPVILTPLALLYARRRLHGDRSMTFGYFGVALSFGLMTMLGFASYLLGVAIMLFALTMWLELLAAADDPRASTWRREAAMAAFAPIVFVSHGHAFIIFLALAGVACLAAGHRLRRIVRLRALVLAVGFAAYVAWLERGAPAGSVAAQTGMDARFQTATDKLTLLITPTLITRTGVDAFVGLALWGLVAAGVVTTLRALRTRGPREHGAIVPAAAQDDAWAKHSRALFAGVALLVVAFLALPHAVGWFGFVDGRLVPLMLILAMMAMRREAFGRLLGHAFDKAGPVAAGAMVAVALVASYRFQSEARGYKDVLAAVPARARLLNLPLNPNSDIFTAHPFIHYDKLALAERPVVVSDIWFHQGSALYPTADNPALRLPSSYSESDLRFIDWPAYRLADWDYVLIRTRPDAPAPQAPASLSLAEHRGGWWLYRTASSPVE
jgi:hypothetical protein